LRAIRETSGQFQSWAAGTGPDLRVLCAPLLGCCLSCGYAGP